MTSPPVTAAAPTGPANPRPRPAAPGSRGRGVLWHVCCLAVLAVVLYPVLWLLSASLKPADEVVTSLSLLPGHLVGANYRQAMAGTGGISVWTYLVNSLIVCCGAVAGNVASCSLAAFAFARLRFAMRGPLFALMLLTIMLPVHVVLIPQYVIFQKLQLVDTFVPLILPKFLATDAFFIFLMVQFMRGLPFDLDEAAALDGCGVFRRYWHIILPLSRPALITTSIFTFIWTWNDFFSQLVYLNSPDKYTLPLALQTFIDQAGQSAYGPMFALSVLALLPILLFFLAFQRFLVEGVSTSGLKG